MTKRSGSESRRRTGHVGVRLDGGELELVRVVAERTGRSLGATLRDAYLTKDVPHDHTTFVQGCFRCELNKDEL